MTELTETPKPERLWGRSPWDDAQNSVRALTFGRLVQLAAPIVEHYVSDLYHDARWLEQYTTGEDLTFWFACNDWGTAIGTSEELVRSARAEHVWRVELTADYDQWGSADWYLKITDVTD